MTNSFQSILCISWLSTILRVFNQFYSSADFLQISEFLINFMHTDVFVTAPSDSRILLFSERFCLRLECFGFAILECWTSTVYCNYTLACSQIVFSLKLLHDGRRDQKLFQSIVLLYASLRSVWLYSLVRTNCLFPVALARSNSRISFNQLSYLVQH